MAELLPPNATAAESALSGALARLTTVPVPVRSALDPEHCAEEMLPWLAWAFSVDAWASEAPVYVKRRTILQSLQIHRRKGTLAALRDNVATVGVPADFEEWHHQVPPGDPYTFRVLLNSIATPVTQADISRLLATIDATKNLRSHLTEVVPGLTSSATANVAAVTSAGIERQIVPGYADVSLLLAAIEDGEAVVSAAADALHQHINYTLPARAEETP